jgi:hypothetical protein
VIEADHFFPRGTPGSNAIVPACSYCNNFKDAWIFGSLDEARAYLKPRTDAYRRVVAQEIRRRRQWERQR